MCPQFGDAKLHINFGFRRGAAKNIGAVRGKTDKMSGLFSVQKMKKQPENGPKSSSLTATETGPSSYQVLLKFLPSSYYVLPW
jgi:hypothetical protein